MSSAEHPNAALLRAGYADLNVLATACADDVVVHSNGSRGVATGDWIGKAAFLERLGEMFRRSGNSIALPVDNVIANDHFGVVLARFTADNGDQHLDVPICGVWRIDDGTLVEHWENVADWAAFDDFFEPEPADRSVAP